MSTAIILGGKSGIGKATAIQLATQGVEVHIVGVNPNKLVEAQSEIQAYGKVKTHRVDITDQKDFEGFIKSINEMPKIDHLVNASGIFGPKP